MPNVVCGFRGKWDANTPRIGNPRKYMSIHGNFREWRSHVLVSPLLQWLQGIGQDHRMWRLWKARSRNLFTSWRQLGPNKQGLVTYIQVNVSIGNTLSWLGQGFGAGRVRLPPPPPVALAEVVLVLLIHCLLLVGVLYLFCCSLLGVLSGFTVVLAWGGGGWLLCFDCLPGMLWLLVFCDSSSRCHGLLCSVWLWYFLLISLTFWYCTNCKAECGLCGIFRSNFALRNNA